MGNLKDALMIEVIDGRIAGRESFITLIGTLLLLVFLVTACDVTNLPLRADLDTSNMYYFWRMPTSRSDKFGGSSKGN